MARKRKLEKKRIFIPEWLELKPYDQHTSYDEYYVRLANKILTVLKKNKSIFLAQIPYTIQDYKSLALMISSYFEDFISEIGIWNAFIQRNKQECGFLLPFYDLSQYEYDYLNMEDLSFIIWFHASKTTESFYNPDYMHIWLLGGIIKNMLEPLIDEAPTTEYYDEYFKIADDVNFFEVKGKLSWFAQFSYLLGFEFSPQIETDITNFMTKQLERNDTNIDFGKYAYAIVDDYYYKKRSSFCAYTTTEWMADVVYASDKIKQSLRDTEKRVMGQFIYLKQDETYYYVKYPSLETEFRIIRESFVLDSSTKKGDLLIAHLIPWMGEWWVSGSVMIYPDPPQKQLEEVKQDYMSTPFFLYEEEIQQKIYSSNKEMYQLFIEFFGKPFICTKNNYQASKALEAFMEYNNKQSPTNKSSSSKNQEKWQEEEWKEQEGVAICYVPSIGTMMSEVIPEVVYLLQQEELSDDDENMLFFSIFGDAIHPETLTYILANYPTHHLDEILDFDFSVLENQAFIKRYQCPNDFGLRIPNIRTTS